MRRLLLNDETADAVSGDVPWTGTYGPASVDRADNWLIDVSLVESGQPITAAATVTLGSVVRDSLDIDSDGSIYDILDVNGDGAENYYDRERWIYFGTGRFITREDAENIDQQSYYGIKEPVDLASGAFSYETVTRADLLDVTNAAVYGDSTVTGVSPTFTGSTSVDTWYDLLDEIDHDDNRGWYRNFADPKKETLARLFCLVRC